MGIRGWGNQGRGKTSLADLPCIAQRLVALGLCQAQELSRFELHARVSIIIVTITMAVTTTTTTIITATTMLPNK
jgi:hypothetical protein